MMNPQIGDPVIVRYLGERQKLNGFVLQGSKAQTFTIAGTLGVELKDGHAVGIVVETDGGATFVRTNDIVSVEVDS